VIQLLYLIAGSRVGDSQVVRLNVEADANGSFVTLGVFVMPFLPRKIQQSVLIYLENALVS
jgi:hypothetical protein